MEDMGLDLFGACSRYVDFIGSERYFEKVIENIPLGVFILDESGRCLYKNEAYQHLLGFENGDWSGTPAGSRSHPDDLDKAAQAFRSVLSGEAARFSARSKKRNGKPGHIDIKLSQLKVRGQGLVLGLAREIKEESETMTSTNTKEDSPSDSSRDAANGHGLADCLIKAMDAVSDLVCVIDKDYKIVRINSAMSKSIGLASGDAAGRRCTDVLCHAQDPPSYCPHRLVLNDGSGHGGEVELFGKGAKFGVNAYPVRDGSGRLAGSVVVAKDESKALKALEEMMKKDASYKFYFENVSDVIFTMTRDGTFTSVSPSVERYLGYKPEELLGKKMPEMGIVAPVHHAKSGREVDAVFEGLSFRISEYEFMARDGTTRVGEVSGSPLFEDGEVTAFLGVARDITERRVAEESRRQAEARYSALMADSLDAVFVHNIKDGSLEDLNQAALKLTGYSRDEIEKVGNEAFFPDESQYRQTAELYAELLKRGAHSRVGELTIRKKDGALARIEVTTSVLRDKDGGPAYFQSVARDRTDTARVAAERERLLKTYKLEKGLMESMLEAGGIREVARSIAPELKDLIDYDCLCLFLGDGKVEEGFTVGERVDCGGDNCLMAGLEERVMSAVKKAADEIITVHLDDSAQTGGVSSVLVAPLIIDGKKFGTLNLGSSHQMEIGELEKSILDGLRAKMALVASRESYIHELKELRRQKEFEHLKLRSMIDNIDQALLMIDDKDLVIDLNLGAARLLGMDREDMLGRGLAEVVSPEVIRRFAVVLEEVKSGRVKTGSVNTRLGKEWMDVSLVAIGEGLPAYNGCILSFVNVTGLVEAQARAEEASRSKSNFLANMSHEIRTPMNGILGFAELLAGSSLTDKQAHYVETITKSGHHLLHLINQILDLSRIEAGRESLDEEPFNPARLALEVAEMVRPQAEKKGLTLRVLHSPFLPDLVVGDGAKIRQVLLNLAGNAVKFTEEGEVSIDIGLSDDHVLVASVTDTGPGIPKRQQDRIFKAFEQSEGGLNRRYEGTGLGLAISSKLVELLGGTIQLDSDHGKGARFLIGVPVRAMSDESGLKGGALLDSLEEEERAEVPKIVLVIDDDPQVREVLKAMLAKFGFNPMLVANGEDGITRAQFYEPAAIILDVRLPDRTGWDVLDVLKKDPITKDIPVIMGTVQDKSRDVKAEGADGWLTKPFSMLELEKALHGCGLKCKPVKRRRKSRPAAEKGPGAGRSGGPKKILIVEDNLTNREVMREVLKERGFAVVEAEDGSEGIRLVEKINPDLVIMDVMMPVMDGLEATRIIRASERHADLPIIAVTASAMDVDREKCVEAGVTEFIAKPIVCDELLKVVEDLLDSDDKENK